MSSDTGILRPPTAHHLSPVMDPERDRDGGREGWPSTTENTMLPTVIKCTTL